MTDLELRRKVAEAVGWTRLRKQENPFMPLELIGMPPGKDDNEYIGRCPAYETDIAAAWGLVEAMGEHCLLINPPYGGLDEYRVGYRDTATNSGMNSCYAPSAPRAISLAYLAWKEAQQ